MEKNKNFQADAMDPGNPTSTIIAKIRNLEPENASKIIDYFLMQDLKTCEWIRLAFGPDTLIHDFCRKAKSDLGLPSKRSSLNPNARPFNIHDQSLSPSSPRNRFLDFSRNPNNPLSPSSIRDDPNFNSGPFRDGSSQQHQLSNHFANLQKRSFSANEAYLESEEPGYRILPGGLADDFGSPGGFGSPSEQQRMIAAQVMGDFGSPMSNKQGSGQFGVEGGFDSPSEQQRMIAAQCMGDFGSPMSNRQGSGQFGVEGGFGSPSEQQRMIAAQCMGDFGSPMSNRQGSGQFGVEGRHGRNDSVSKQIYLTFKPESSFTDEDASTYFSKFGAVEDIRIPYQQQRMFGFVTFANAETVRTILLQANPHLIGGSPVRVKLYKQKGNPNPLSPSLTSNTLRDNLNFHDGSSQQQQQLSNHFPFAANDACLEPEEPGYRFLPGGLVDDFGSSGGFGSPSERIAQHQQPRLMAAAARGSPISNGQGSGQFGVEGGYCRSPGRQEIKDSVSKQIYLTFPPESSFTYVDISTYFSKFGAVEDVKIPYQQQRMFGFVTFANVQTVRTILARGNPHLICGSLVNVKPYKEKEEILQKRQKQQLDQLLERGPRMLSNETHEMLQRKTGQADLQQAVEVEHQRRRFLNQQLPDMEDKSIHHHQRSPSTGSPAHFPPRVMEDDSDRGEKQLQQVATSNKERGYSNDSYKGQETSLENTQPDSLFDSPKQYSETPQTKSDTEQYKEASSDQSA